MQDIPLRAAPIARDPKAQDFPTHLENALSALDIQNGFNSFRTTEVRPPPSTQIFSAPDHFAPSSDQHRSTLPLQSISDLRCKYDFSKVHVHLVSSLSGKFEGWPEVVRVGHPRLMKVVMDIGAKPRPGWEVNLECQVSCHPANLFRVPKFDDKMSPCPRDRV